ncbi:MAG: pyrroloquinoline quinone-dependent dehydrogenase [Bacteroidetes bacterium]|nr:MAG: pyrroloquinoline quinone-dependent dehydrogenase [Bacteroidota bacterium]
MLALTSCQKDMPPVDYTGPVAEWAAYGGTWAAERYSPLTQITPENVAHLEVAWTYHTGDVSAGSEEIPSTSAFEATPILVDSMLYLPSPFNKVIALNPETGAERWVYDPQIDLSGNYANQLICRGVSYWKDTACAEADPCRGRIFMGTNDGRLIALDALTGQPCEDFGQKGEIDLVQGVGKLLFKGEYQITSPPAIAGNLVIVGSAVCDNMRLDAPSGVVRAYDAQSGSLRWSWDLRPPADTLKNLPSAESGFLLGSPNVWAPMAVDEERDLLFVPTGNPAPDYYGGMRRGIDYYGSSIVALRASTGEVVWHFQTVHHDLWDFDVPAQPTLTHIPFEGKMIPAVVQATKMGLLFCLNRETGEPIYGVEERPVPQSDVPGEQTAPTQPFPLKPPPLVPHDLKPSDAWGPLGMNGECEELLQSLHWEGIYTPPKLGQPTLMYPGNAGGSNWGGVAVDPVQHILVANVMDLAWMVELVPTTQYDSVRRANPGMEVAPQTGTPYALKRTALLSSMGLPCNPPPWGSLAAVDLQSGDILWQKPLGTVRDIAPIPLKINYGVPNLGGPMITASGLIFIAAAMDDYIRAFDLHTGEMLWEARLPAGGQATPMTYRIRPDGKQFLVIAAGGHGRAGSRLGDALVAYTLP